MSERSGKMRVSANLLSLAAAVGLVGICAAQSADLAPAVAQSHAANKPTVSVSISAAQDVVKAGSPVFVDMTITNVSSHPVEIEAFGRDWYSQVDVRDSQGNQSLTREGRTVLKHEAPAPAAPDGSGKTIVRMWGLGSETSYPLDAGKSRVFHRQVPDLLFDLSQPGKYTIQVHRVDGPGVVVDSNTVTVTIVP